jgi:hypothetical protein
MDQVTCFRLVGGEDREATNHRRRGS